MFLAGRRKLTLEQRESQQTWRLRGQDSLVSLNLRPLSFSFCTPSAPPSNLCIQTNEAHARYFPTKTIPICSSLLPRYKLYSGDSTRLRCPPNGLTSLTRHRASRFGS